MRRSFTSAFTLIELLVSVALMVILGGVYFMIVNPAGQIATSRNNTRQLNLQTLMVAIRQNIADQGNETFLCSSGSIPTTTTVMASGAGKYNIAPCLVPAYLAVLPYDPSASSAYYTSASNYNTGYTIIENASGSITLTAPSAELAQSISVTR